MTPALAPASTASVKRRRLSQDVAGAHNVIPLGAQLLRHIVEGLSKLGKVATGILCWHLDVKVAGRHYLCGRRSTGDWGHEIIGEVQPDPCR